MLQVGRYGSYPDYSQRLTGRGVWLGRGPGSKALPPTRPL